jgi:2'-5' RNA ligase
VRVVKSQEFAEVSCIRALLQLFVHDLFCVIMDKFASCSGGRLFLAILPDPATAERIHRLASVLKRAHRFSGRLIAADRLHVSLFSLTGLPDHQICAACEAATELRTAPFEVSFDRTASFRGGPGSRPFVLVGEKGLRGLQSFWQALAAALTRGGLRRLANTNFTPHVTLLYDARSADEYPVEPIVWTVAEFVLVHSLKGHRHIVRWGLRA